MTSFRHGVVLLLCAAAAWGQQADAPAFPLKSSSDGRYFVDQKAEPFFYHADTGWQISKRLSREHVEFYLDDRKSKGFNVIQIHTFSKEQGPMANTNGDEPFDASGDILKPNEAYWKNVDFIFEAARSRGLLLAVAPMWIRWGGRDQDGWRFQLNDQNARPYGQFLGRRYGRFDNILWILGGDANPIEDTRAIAEIARGIQDVAPNQRLMTVHNRPEYASAAFFDPEPWLTVNMAYSYQETYIHVLGEYNRLGKVRPIILGESGYELESNDNRGGSPWRMRRQAYQAILSGAVAGHAYGHRDLWKFSSLWKEALNATGCLQMQHLKALFTSMPWYGLIPDQYENLVVQGAGFFGDHDYVTAAVTAEGAWAVVYIPTAKSVTLDLGRLKGPVRAAWFDPTTGQREAVDIAPLPNSGRRQFIPPARNGAGDTDHVLILQADP